MTRIAITAERLDLDARGDFLPKHLGRQMIAFEHLVYAIMDRACDAYSGGLWDFYNLSNGSFYMAPDRETPMSLLWPENFFEGELSPQAAGIGVTLMALSQMSFGHNLTDNERTRLTEKFQDLLDYAASHEEAGRILRFID